MEEEELFTKYKESRRQAAIANERATKDYIDYLFAKRAGAPGKVVAPTKEKKQKKEEEEGPFTCAGNLYAGTPCPGTCTKRAADTRFEKKLHQTCKDCKKAMKKDKKAQVEAE